MRTKKKEEFEETSNKSTKKQGRILTGGGDNFSGWPEIQSLCSPYALHLVEVSPKLWNGLGNQLMS